ncbi:glycoside hydrolase family 2 protein [Deinococcus multiflagellatus]|uniref:Glycoside hydrolase family 2 protein n=1 Tax=Deinococcus multiflagellatus TaxID=1656887 RepID=A0ABW1ZGF7_9DEIO|nr:sugar-binding domain-containing protein [Deinococcus multiflagellatus]MBZ9712912.1 glycoside hydrolase family 2 [Deinococcus multiflagellatus]
MQRPLWSSLDGAWDFAFDPHAAHGHPAGVDFSQQIEVPYPPESRASGLHQQAHGRAVWYRRTVRCPHEWTAGRTLLHFGAVDYHATVWVNGRKVAEHRGGHTPFCVDVTDVADEPFEVVVRAEDDPLALDQPRGKQDWLPEPHSIWYPRTTGIWQTVWVERVPGTAVDRLEFQPDLDTWGVHVRALVQGYRPGLKVRVLLSVPGETLADDVYSLTGAELHRVVPLLDGGIDSHRSHLLWSPEHPQLIDALVEVLDSASGEVLDRVVGYTALRSVTIEQGRFLLNGSPYPLRLVLDQGYWPESLMTATSDQYRADVELTKRLGFNGVRKHQKLEDPQYLYWADRLGLLVWAEMPSAYRLSDRSIQSVTAEWMEAVMRDRGHPCVVAWVPFNESWGVPDLTRRGRSRSLVRALYELTRSLDPTRPVIGNDGWENDTTDILTIHDYTPAAEVLRERYGTREQTRETLLHARPGGRNLLLDPALADRGLPVMLTEFGGIAYMPDHQGGWGYSHAQDSESFTAHYESLLSAVHESQGLAGFCYTQLTDTFQEKNGLLDEYRRFKGDPARLRHATAGRRDPRTVNAAEVPDPFGYSPEWQAKQLMHSFGS